MPIGIIFWVLFIIWVLFYASWRLGGLWGPHGDNANGLLLVLLLFILGWHSFGFIVRG